MSEEDTFLDGIGADRADRTRLLVFADWLADRGDPREEFVRLHAKLLDMDGTEPEFEERNEVWNIWVNEGTKPRANRPWIGNRWLDAMCRVCTSADIEPYLHDADYAWWSAAERTEHVYDYDTLVLYHGLARDFVTPLEFLAGTIAIDIGNNEWFPAVVPLQGCEPITRGKFWRLWREQLAALRNPPPLPETVSGNRFLGAQYFDGSWAFWAAVAVYQHDYFALFWTTTD
jgi:uncharacterized protein (TIGR02996 family)